MKKTIKIISIIGAIFGVAFFFYAFKANLFNDPKAFQEFIHRLGPFGIFVFILIQIIQPIIPIIPGGLSDVAGILMFGNVLGLLYVCTGLVIGEVIVFFLVRKYGRKFVENVLPDKGVAKFDEILAKGDKNMAKILIIVFLMPFGPDDIACYAAGFSSLSFKKYLAILVILKPISVGIHCYLAIYVFKTV